MMVMLNEIHFHETSFGELKFAQFSGFIKTIVLEIVPTVFPLKSVTRPPLIAIAGGIGKPCRLASLDPSIWQCSPQSVMSILYPNMSQNPILHRIVSTPSRFRIVDVGEIEMTIPTRSSMELTGIV